MSKYLRMDKGTETGKIAAMHTYLASNTDLFDDPTDSIVYGPSTTNKIERLWREIHESLEKYFKVQLKSLLESREYDPPNEMDRKMSANVFIPVVQRECDIFVKMRNSHRIREKPNLELPTRIPDHMFAFPEKYGASTREITLTKEQLREVADVSSILDVPMEIMDINLKQAFQQIIPNPMETESKNDAYPETKSCANRVERNILNLKYIQIYCSSDYYFFKVQGLNLILNLFLHLQG